MNTCGSFMLCEVVRTSYARKGAACSKDRNLRQVVGLLGEGKWLEKKSTQEEAEEDVMTQLLLRGEHFNERD